MKRVIIDIPDEYAGAVSVTAIGVRETTTREVVAQLDDKE